MADVVEIVDVRAGDGVVVVEDGSLAELGVIHLDEAEEDLGAAFGKE